MRHTLILVLSLLLSLPLSAREPEGIKFETGSLAAALKKATGKKGAPALVFVDCYTEWCGPCKQMDAKVFTLPEVGDFFNKNLINIKIDMEKGEGLAIAEKYKITSYPTYLLLDSRGNEIYRFFGATRADIFLQKIKLGMNPAAKEAIKNAYEREKTFKNALAYLAILRVDAPGEQQQVVADIFSLLTVEERYSSAFWPYLSAALANARGPLFDAVMRDKWEADRILSRECVNATLRQGLIALAAQHVSGKMNNVDPVEIANKLNLLPFVAREGDPEVGYISRVVQLFNEGKIEEISTMLDVRALSALGEQARTQVEWFIMGVMGMPADVVLKYYTGRIEHLDNYLAQLKKFTELHESQSRSR